MADLDDDDYDKPDFTTSPTWADIGQRMNQWLFDRDHEWCGFPMPLPGTRLIVEENHPHAEQIAQLQAIVTEDDELAGTDDEGPVSALVNTWRTTWKGYTGYIRVWRQPDGTTTWDFAQDAYTRNSYLFNTFIGADAWTVEAEQRACDRLRTVLSARQWLHYFTTGGFLELSTRSGLHYWFRRLRPTVVFRRFSATTDDEVSILCALCLHPVAYYHQTWCGAMVPTDDVIAHLLMMRSDEHRFWARANQHPAIDPEAGLT